MNIQLQTQGFELTPALTAHAYRQLHFNLSNFENHVMSVSVYLRDLNGPKGGPDKKALVCIRLGSRLSVKVENTHADLYAAITLAARRAKRATKRTLRKHRYMEKLALRNLRQYPQY